MSPKNRASQFEALVHRSISFPIKRAIEADSLSTEISDRRSWINHSNFGHLFSVLQFALADEFVLCVTRIYDAPPRKYPTQSISAILNFMDEHARWLPVRNRTPLEDLLTGEGVPRSEVEAASDTNLTRRISAYYRARLPDANKPESSPLSASLQALRFRRDKQIAHAEAVNPRKQVQAAWDDARVLVRWALEFADVIGRAYLNHYFLASDGKTYLGDHSARNAARDLGTLLEEVGLFRGPVRHRRNRS